MNLAAECCSEVTGAEMRYCKNSEEEAAVAKARYDQNINSFLPSEHRRKTSIL